MDKHVLGIDPSLTATGLVIYDVANSDIVAQHLLSSKHHGIRRLIDLRSQFVAFVTAHPVAMMCIEGYAYGMTDGSMLASLGELGGALRMYLEDSNKQYYNVSPGTLKKYVTGKGNSKKQLMLMFTLKNWGVAFEDDNLCDAYGLARIASLMLLDAKGCVLNKTEQLLVKGIKKYDSEVNRKN